jgi:hypothetical protein
MAEKKKRILREPLKRPGQVKSGQVGFGTGCEPFLLGFASLYPTYVYCEI